MYFIIFIIIFSQFGRIVVNNNTAYVVTFGAEAPEYDKNIQDVEKPINSIKIDREAMENVHRKIKINPRRTTGTSRNLFSIMPVSF
jgi:hypothetical protein